MGLALACRLPEEVLLVRDDHDKFLFDVSTVPHIAIDFTNPVAAKATLAEALADRLRAQRYANDARVDTASASLTNAELALLGELTLDEEGHVRGWNPGGTVLSVHEHAVSRLLDKGIIRVGALFENGTAGRALTPLGRHVAARAMSLNRVATKPARAADA